MNIVLSGVGVANKGAELMTYAVLQEIEKKYPQATVYVSTYVLDPYGINYIDTSLKLKFVPYHSLIRLCNKLKLYFFKDIFSACSVPKADFFIDFSGFLFSDQFNLTSKQVDKWCRTLKNYHDQGTRICFLSQAFGPITKENTKRVIKCISEYADLVVAREKVSYTFLKEFGFPSEKLYLYTDFTSTVQPVLAQQYSHLRDGICIIPNERMVSMGIISIDEYIKFLNCVSKKAQSFGKTVFFLNHGGVQDYELAKRCSQSLETQVEVIQNINALEVKGVLSSSYLCISSRFHGVASSLNCNVPCLATSWSHKYKELFSDYNINGCILNLNDLDSVIDKLEEYLDPSNNENTRKILSEVHPKIKKQADQMWTLVWNK